MRCCSCPLLAIGYCLASNNTFHYTASVVVCYGPFRGPLSPCRITCRVERVETKTKHACNHLEAKSIASATVRVLRQLHPYDNQRNFVAVTIACDFYQVCRIERAGIWESMLFFWYGRRGCERFAPSNQPVKLLVGICKAPVCEDSPLARVASNHRKRLTGFRHWHHNQPAMTISRHLHPKYGLNGRTNAQLPNLVAEFTKPKSEQVPMW
jgi:hypothetical protein